MINIAFTTNNCINNPESVLIPPKSSINISDKADIKNIILKTNLRSFNLSPNIDKNNLPPALKILEIIKSYAVLDETKEDILSIEPITDKDLIIKTCLILAYFCEIEKG